MSPGKGWALAADVLRRALATQGAGGDRDTVGWVRYLGEGMTYVTYGATCRLPGGREIPLVVRLPRPGGGENQTVRALREEKLLRYLASVELPFRIPRGMAALPVEDGLALVQEWVDGIPADLRASRFPGGRPWELVAEVATSIHGLDPEPLRSLLPGPATRRDHARVFARVLESVSGCEGEDMRAWVREHLPPEEPSRILHGDLLGQNLLLPWEEEGPGVVDWAEAALGDPAYDLAIVTRGVRHPFQAPGGLHRLLKKYAGGGGQPISATQVHLHELFLRCKLYLDAAERSGLRSPHARDLRRAMMGVFHRAQKA